MNNADDVLRAKLRLLKRKMDQEKRELNITARKEYFKTGRLDAHELFEKNDRLNRMWLDYDKALSAAVILREESNENLELAWRSILSENVFAKKFWPTIKTMRSTLRSINRK